MRSTKVPKELMDRDWTILDLRYGPDRSNTLQEVGDAVGVTRERVRQIANRALAAAEYHHGKSLDLLEIQWTRQMHQSNDFETTQTPTVFFDWLDTILNEHLNSIRVVALLRGLSLTKGPKIFKRWPLLSLHACLMAPRIERHPEVARISKQEDYRWTYNELAEKVLTDAGEPLHWREIVDRGIEMGLRSDIYPSSMFNAIQSADEIFARVGQGTYGLTAWGLEDVPFFKELIRDTLKEQGCVMSKGALKSAVDQRRRIKPESLAMYLDLDPIFYRSVNGEYGLREWLPPRHRQTLSTPRTLIESRESRRRLSSAKNTT